MPQLRSLFDGNQAKVGEDIILRVMKDGHYTCVLSLDRSHFLDATSNESDPSNELHVQVIQAIQQFLGA